VGSRTAGEDSRRRRSERATPSFDDVQLRPATFQSLVDSFTDYTFELSKGTSSFATKSQPTDVMDRSKGIDVLAIVPESVKGSYGGE
jgi:hypothetical protein